MYLKKTARNREHAIVENPFDLAAYRLSELEREGFLRDDVVNKSNPVLRPLFELANDYVDSEDDLNKRISSIAASRGMDRPGVQEQVWKLYSENRCVVEGEYYSDLDVLAGGVLWSAYKDGRVSDILIKRMRAHNIEPRQIWMNCFLAKLIGDRRLVDPLKKMIEQHSKGKPLYCVSVLFRLGREPDALRWLQDAAAGNTLNSRGMNKSAEKYLDDLRKEGLIK
jgi:hypothetical protein